MLREFKDFVMKGNILEIAVGLVMALYFQQVVDAFLDSVLYPLIAGLVGQPSFSQIGFAVGDVDPETGSRPFVSIGNVIDAVIGFVLVAFVLFLILKAASRVQKPKQEVAGPSEVELLIEIRDQLRANG